MLIDHQRLAINPHSKATKVRTGPEEHQEVLVIDDFFADPGYVRTLGLNLDFADMRGTYPGYEARISLDIGAILARTREFTDPTLKVIREYGNAFVFSMMDERVDPWLRHYPHPHTDKIGAGIACLAGMVYLNPPEQCRGGTGFYRHRESGACDDREEMSPQIAAYMVKHGLVTVTAAYEHMTRLSESTEAEMRKATAEWGYLCESNDTWELLAMIEMKFNRFVVFDSHAFHHPFVKSGQFGHTKETRRLTLTTFFELPE